MWVRYARTLDWKTSVAGWRNPLLADALMAALVGVLTVFGTLEAAHGQTEARSLDPLGHGLLIAAALCVGLIRRAPLLAVVGALACQVAYDLLDYPEGTEWLPAIVALGGAAAAGYRVVVIGVASTLLLWMMGARVLGGDWPLDGDTLLAVAGFAAAIFAGEWTRTRRAYLASIEERVELAERSKEDEARRRVDEERLRIAREMHDVLAHSLASINVQAGVTLHLLQKHPEQIPDGLAAIKAASGEALQELRDALGVLRQEDDGSTARLASLETLIDSAQTAGLRVRVRTVGPTYDLPAPVDLAAYRIVQESLTNAIRYAAPADVTVALEYSPAELRIRVEDDGNGPTVPSANGAGTGITGMRERASALGGRLDAGPRSVRGFYVHAVLPTKASTT